MAGSEERHSRQRIPDGLRGPLFAGGAILGVLLFAFGMGFFILGLAVDASPPAPYLQSTIDRLILLGVAVSGMVVGAGIVRGAARVVGW